MGGRSRSSQSQTTANTTNNLGVSGDGQLISGNGNRVSKDQITEEYSLKSGSVIKGNSGTITLTDGGAIPANADVSKHAMTTSADTAKSAVQGISDANAASINAVTELAKNTALQGQDIVAEQAGSMARNFMIASAVMMVVMMFLFIWSKKK